MSHPIDRPGLIGALRCVGGAGLCGIALLTAFGLIPAASGQEPVDIGGRRQLFVDRFIVAKLDGLEMRLHSPCPREIVMVRNKPWEGSGTQYERIIRDKDLIRMYYMASQLSNNDATTGGGWVDAYVAYACCAESRDGIHWSRPDVGLFDFGGSKHNNIVWAGPAGLDNFTPFLDTNPDCPASERYKAMMSYGFGGLFAFKSADGIHWSYLSKQPVIVHGTFDSQNNAFWDPLRKQYWCYLRGFHKPNGDVLTTIGSWSEVAGNMRDIRVSTSKDFRHWTEPKLIKFDDSLPDEQLYTNQVEPYYRAPEVFLGFPTRYIERQFSPAALLALPDPVHRRRRMGFNRRYGTAVTDGQFMTSRDGYSFRRWDETFIRPGPQRSNNWVYGDGYQSLGLLVTPAEDPTAPPELSFYLDEGHFKESEPLRRYTIRIDGFVSLHAREKTGQFLSKPLIFSGGKLSLNFSTSAGGSILVELLDHQGRPIPGFSMGDCDQLFGDTLDRTVTWRNRSDLHALSGKTVRIRMALSDADLYSLVFQE